jgi:class 3 adenylate cyclase
MVKRGNRDSIVAMNSGGRERVERRLAAVLAADVAGHSRLMGEDEEGTHAALTALRRELSDPKIAEHRGRIAHLGRIEEGHDCLRRMFHFEPGLTIARVKASARRFPTELLNRYVEGLRKAGLPEGQSCLRLPFVDGCKLEERNR